MKYLDPLLLDISVSCFPHEEVFNYILHGLPGQKVFLDVVEVLAVLLNCLLEEVCLGTAPVFHLVTTQHRTCDYVRV